MLILNDLEPYRHRTQDEVKALRELNLVSDAELILKADFMGFVKRFERENDNILEFGTAVPYSEKINNIYKTLLSYAEQRAERPSRA